MYVPPKLSAKARMKAPAMAPGMLPIPPSTITAKALRITEKPIVGESRLIEAISVAAAAARPAEMAKTIIETRSVSIPTSAAPARFLGHRLDRRAGQGALEEEEQQHHQHRRGGDHDQLLPRWR